MFLSPHSPREKILKTQWIQAYESQTILKWLWDNILVDAIFHHLHRYHHKSCDYLTFILERMHLIVFRALSQLLDSWWLEGRETVLLWIRRINGDGKLYNFAKMNISSHIVLSVNLNLHWASFPLHVLLSSWIQRDLILGKFFVMWDRNQLHKISFDVITLHCGVFQLKPCGLPHQYLSTD